MRQEGGTGAMLPPWPVRFYNFASVSNFVEFCRIFISCIQENNSIVDGEKYEFEFVDGLFSGLTKWEAL
jgi:hypothetical protein